MKEAIGVDKKEGVQWKTSTGDKTSGKADKPSNTKADTCEKAYPNGSTLFETKTSGRRTHPSNKGKQEERQDGRQAGKQDLGKADTPWETQETRGDKTAGRRTHHPRLRHHPTQAHMWGDKGETRPREGGHTIATQVTHI